MTEAESSGRRRIKRVAKALLPPIIPFIYRLARARLGKAATVEWEYLPSGWPAESRSVRGWNSKSVLDSQVATWDEFVAAQRSTAPVGLSRGPDGSVVFNDELHNTVLTFAYVLARAARGREKMSMLDWGGGIGAYLVYASALLPDLELDYTCRELPLLAEGGRRLLPAAVFYSDEEAALARHYDFVMASSSLHYSRDWRVTLGQLAAVTDGYLYLTRLPVVDHARSFVVLQRPYRYGYETEYPGWFINRGELLRAAADLDLTLLKEFLIGERPQVPNAPEAADYRGFLFAAAPR